VALRQQPHAVSIPVGDKPTHYIAVSKIVGDSETIIIYRDEVTGAVVSLPSHIRPPQSWELPDGITTPDLTTWWGYLEDNIDAPTLAEALLLFEEA